MRLQKRNRSFYVILLFCLTLSVGLMADTPPPVEDTLHTADSTVLDSAISTADNALLIDSVNLEPVLYEYGSDTLLIKSFATSDSVVAKGESPSMHMLKSVIFPGWGQFSNRKYVKAVLVFAIETYYITNSIKYTIDASDKRDIWKSTPDSLATLKAENFRAYTEYRDSRNSNYWMTAIITFLSMIDAYVDAHLSNFPDKADEPSGMSLDISPGRESRLVLSYRF